MTVRETADLLDVSEMTVCRLVHSGEFPAVRVGRGFRIPTRVVHDYLASSETTSRGTSPPL
ncbi:helix-turn-helix domain-containing protein [Streptomyces sp. IB2014 016-6]|uniref:helix-turn-helix domain-containing protein n=1 Tax=Streptomyces sp. IB2014 016-6 TaxID=2517818 RepID=UPI001F4F91DD|nr:helix-turn-helix domain-containing protein [Streptomyces sp. IB2014 016-6]